MDASLSLLLGLLVGLALGAVVGVLVSRSRQVQAAEPVEVGEDPALVEARHRAELNEARHAAEVEHARIRAELTNARAEVEARLAAASAQAQQLREQVGDAQQQYRDAVERHRLEEQRREAAGAAESKVLQQLAPVATQLRDMRAKVDELEKQRSEQHGHLAAQIRASQASAERSREAAEMLSSALRNNSVRGAYGETQLRSLVESAGLLHRVDFTTQESIVADSGARRPDMIVKLPGRKQMAVDAKMPYSAYIESCRADLDDERRSTLLVQHARQVKQHVDALAGKEYWTGLETSPEFTVAFIPSEAILNAALDADHGLMEHAFGRGIVLATPVNLWAVLKTVAFTWKQEDLADNAQELVDLGRELYKRLGTLTDHVTKLGRSIERTVTDYNKFAGSLEGRVLATARKLDAGDGAVTQGRVEQIEAPPRSLTAAEMTSSVADERPRPSAEEALFADLDRPELDFTVDAEVVEGDERTG